MRNRNKYHLKNEEREWPLDWKREARKRRIEKNRRKKRRFREDFF